MSGNPASTVDESSEVSKALLDLEWKFDIPLNKAKDVCDYFTYRCTVHMTKWIKNYRKTQQNTAEEILRLLKQLKKGNNKVIPDIEKLILQLCVGDK